MDILDKDIYALTSLVQSGIQNYIYTETTNFENVKAGLDKKNRQMVTTYLVTFACGNYNFSIPYHHGSKKCYYSCP